MGIKKLISMSVSLATAVLLAATSPSSKRSHEPLHQSSYQDIVSRYTFVGDFSLKPEGRKISDKLFWRYPYKIPKVQFPILWDLENPDEHVPATEGTGRPVAHLNRGRVLFLKGRYEEAKATWLAARSLYGKTFKHHRRNDYFIGLAMMKIARGYLDSGLGYDSDEVSATLANAATFLSWALIVKEDHPDPLMDRVAPRALYNLAAIYWRYDRFAGAFGAADKGLHFLRKTGRKEFRSQFNRITAEAYIKNRTYLEAVQALDRALRQDHNPEQAGAIFARVGDIYFDLNNYELAEDAYGLGAQIDNEMKQVNPAQLILRGESLFWLGRFSEAQKMLHFGLEGPSILRSMSPLSDHMAAWAALRIADSYLARDEMEKAKLAYYKVERRYRKSLAGQMARIRRGCLELPEYGGNNVHHAREVLEQAKVVGLPEPLVELAWACQVASYAERERTRSMVERVRKFAAQYPESRFLQSFLEPVREVQADRIDDYFKANDPYSAVDFFEKNRNVLFPKVDQELARQLFVAYTNTHQSPKATEFWQAHHSLPDSDEKLLRDVVVAVEMEQRGAGKIWTRRARQLASRLEGRDWKVDPTDSNRNYFLRVLTSSYRHPHLPWLARLARHWGRKKQSFICDYEFTVLSQMYDRDPDRREEVSKRIRDLVDELLPNLFKTDEACSLSLLDLEARTMRNTPDALARRYIDRQSWPLHGAFLNLYWTISEKVHAAGEHRLAEELWKIIRDKGQADSPEVGFAKARLDKTKTEYEKLWD